MGTTGIYDYGQGQANRGSFLISQSGIYLTDIENLNQGGSALSDREQDELTERLQNNSQYRTQSGSGSATGSSYTTTSQYGRTSQQNVNDAIDKFYYATYQWGTDDEDMESVLKGINSNNVMDIMKTWNKYHSKEKGESFMEAFMWDADGDQKVTYGRQIARALRDRAEAAGIYDEDMAAAFAKIDNELRCSYIENNIHEKFDEIIYRIAEAEAEKLADAEPDEDKKAEVKEEALKYAKPYDASSETKSGWDNFWDGAAKVCDSIGNFFLGWI